MEKQRLRKYINQPQLLDKSSLSDLYELTQEFPYFQTAWALLSRNLNALDDHRFDDVVKKAAIYAVDRSRLKQLIFNTLPVHEKPSTVVEVLAEEKQETVEQSKPLAEPEKVIPAVSLNSEKGLTGKAEPTEVEEYILSDEDFFDFKPSNLKKETQETSSLILHTNLLDNIEKNSPENKKQKLLDKFITDMPEIKPQLNKTKPFESEKASREENESTNLVSETLAKIYISQGHYEKALTTYQKLSLKYPQKSIYFAVQIEKIKNLIEIKEK